MSSSLQNNITNLQSILETINNLPEAGIDLPELSNPATPEELFANKELIDNEGNVITGTFTIDSELSTQDNLIAQIQTAVDGLPAANGGLETCFVTIKTRKIGFLDYSAACFKGQYEVHTNGYCYDQGNNLGYVELTFDSVICGSLMYVYSTEPVTPAYSVVHDSEVWLPKTSTSPYVWCIKVTSSPNVHEIITLRDDAES